MLKISVVYTGKNESFAYCEKSFPSAPLCVYIYLSILDLQRIGEQSKWNFVVTFNGALAYRNRKYVGEMYNHVLYWIQFSLQAKVTKSAMHYGPV